MLLLFPLEVQQKKREFRRKLLMEKMNMTRSSSHARVAPRPEEFSSSTTPAPAPTPTPVEVVAKPEAGTYSPCTTMAPSPSLSCCRPLVPRAEWVPVSAKVSSSEVVFSAKLLHYGVHV